MLSTLRVFLKLSHFSLPWDKVGVGKFDGLIGEVTVDPLAEGWGLFVAETGVVACVAVVLFGSASGA